MFGDNEDPPGYKTTYSGIGRRERFKFLLPLNVAQTIEKEEQDEREAAVHEEISKNAAQRAAENHPSVSVASSVKPKSSSSEQLDYDDEAQYFRDNVEAEYDPRRFSPAYTFDEPLKLIKNLGLKSPDKDGRDRVRAIYTKLKQRTNLREIGKYVDHEVVDRLRNLHPHFGSVIDLVRDQVILADRAQVPMSVPPILLLGEPGIGKTRFASDLASVLCTDFRRLSLDSDQTGAYLLGSDRRWSNTTYGLLFEVLALGNSADPVILLDEIDKAGRIDGSDPRASLHQLLEPSTSTCVRDISLDFEMNASRVIWIATANDARRIPASLRSRFREFLIEAPTGEGALLMARSVADCVHYEMAIEDFELPPNRIVHKIAHLSAREQSQVLRQAFASAVANDRRHLVMADLPADVLDEPGKPSPRLH